MNFYERMAATTNKILQSKGQEVTIAKQTVGDYSVATSSASVTETTQTGYGVLLDHGDDEIDGTLIKFGDKRLLLTAIDITAPTLGDKVTVDSIVYTIVPPLKTISPAGTTVLYDLNLRA